VAEEALLYASNFQKENLFNIHSTMKVRTTVASSTTRAANSVQLNVNDDKRMHKWQKNFDAVMNTAELYRISNSNKSDICSRENCSQVKHLAQCHHWHQSYVSVHLRLHQLKRTLWLMLSFLINGACNTDELCHRGFW
jgi:protein-arginine kinase activator protein McsA